jgi:hypothetical protein
MKVLLLAAILTLVPGCAGMLLLKEIDAGHFPTQDEVAALDKIGAAVYGCFTIAGPPPAGNTVWLIVPKGTPVTFAFGDNCHLITR